MIWGCMKCASMLSLNGFNFNRQWSSQNRTPLQIGVENDGRFLSTCQVLLVSKFAQASLHWIWLATWSARKQWLFCGALLLDWQRLTCYMHASAIEFDLAAIFRLFEFCFSDFRVGVRGHVRYCQVCQCDPMWKQDNFTGEIGGKRENRGKFFRRDFGVPFCFWDSASCSLVFQAAAAPRRAHQKFQKGWQKITSGQRRWRVLLFKKFPASGSTKSTNWWFVCLNMFGFTHYKLIYLRMFCVSLHILNFGQVCFDAVSQMLYSIRVGKSKCTWSQ